MVNIEVTEMLPPPLVAQFLREPDIFYASGDDMMPPPEEVPFEARMMHPHIATYSVLVDDELVGFVQYERKTFLLCEIHCGFLRGFRGKFAIAVIRRTMASMFLEKGMTSIVAMVPSDNVPAIRLARVIGFAHWGRLRNAVLRGGQLRDYIVLGVTRDGKYNADALRERAKGD